MEGMVDREGLLKMVPPGPGAPCVLAVESLAYLPELCRMLPHARIEAVTMYEDAAGLPGYRDLSVAWSFLDFRSEPLPFGPGRFDLALAEPCLTDAYAPEATLEELGRLLKDTGELVTQFRNIRYWRVLEGLRQGVFPERERRLFAKSEIVPMLHNAVFHEVAFAPLRQDRPETAAEWEAMGFENFSHDLATEIWMVRACRSTAEAAALKSLYTRETRALLARLLRRIEYGIDREQSLAALWKLCREQGIFPEYLSDFAAQAVVHEEALDLLRQEAASRL